MPHVSWWMMHLDTRGSGDDDDQVPGVIDITLRGSGESIESPGEGRLIIASGVDQDFWKLGEERESLGGDKHDTPCIVYQLGAIIC